MSPGLITDLNRVSFASTKTQSQGFGEGGLFESRKREARERHMNV